MITGAHIIVYTKDPDADRAFFKDVLGFASVDAGHGWLIFALPPAEAAFHPADENNRHELFLMCDDLPAAMPALAKKGIRCSTVQEVRWGSITKVQLPGGGELGLYQPKHATAISLKSSGTRAARAPRKASPVAKARSSGRRPRPRSH